MTKALEVMRNDIDPFYESHIMPRRNATKASRTLKRYMFYKYDLIKRACQYDWKYEGKPGKDNHS